MKLLVGLLFAIMAVAPAAFADEAAEIKELKRYMTHLNTQYQDLNVRNKNNLKNAQVRQQTDRELQDLENFLAGEIVLDNAALKQLLCGRPQCDGGDEIKLRELEK